MKSYSILITIAVAIALPIIFLGIAMTYYYNKSNKTKKDSNVTMKKNSPCSSDEYISIFDEEDCKKAPETTS